MNPRLLILPIVFILNACSERTIESNSIIKDTIDKKEDSILLINTETFFIANPDDSSTGYYNLIHPVVFIDNTPVYAKRDTSSEIITTLSFNTSIHLPLERYSGLNRELSCIMINNKLAYIPHYAISPQTFTTTSKGNSFKYFIINHFSPIDKSPMGGFTVYKYDLLKKQFVDSIQIEYRSAHIVKELNHVAWKNVDILLCIEEIRAYCGGGQSQTYIIDANNKLQKLICTGEHYDDGEEAMVMGTSISFPKNVATDTILFSKFENANLFDKKDILVTDKNGEPKRTGYDSLTYYKWDGKSLVKIGEAVKTY